MGLIFTLLMTYGGAIVSLFRPYYGFLIYVSFSILRPEFLWHWSVPAGNYSRIIAVAFLFGWAINGGGNLFLGRARQPAIAIALFMVWSILSAVVCMDRQVGLQFVENMAKIILPLLAGLTLIKTQRDVYLLASTLVISFGYLAYELNLSYFEGFNRLQQVGFGGMDNNSLTIGLVTGVGFSFFLGLSEPVVWRRYLYFGASALMTHAVFFSFSRGGMLGLCVVGVVTAFLIPKTGRNMSLMTLGFVVAMAMAGPEVVERFSSITRTSVSGASETEVESSAESRLLLWNICWQMTRESPVFGKGPDHFTLLVNRYSVDGRTFPRGKEAHGMWQQIAAELGVPGLFFLAAYFGLTMLYLWPYSRLDRSDSIGLTPGATARMVIAAMAGYTVSGSFVSLEGLEFPYYACLVGLGMLKVVSTEDYLESANENLLAPVVDESNINAAAV